MAGPVTWRNISGGSFGSSAGLLNAGQQQVQQGLQALQNLFAVNQKEDAANREAVKNYNTQQYLDQVAATDMQTLATPEAQAALAQQRQSYGVGIDQALTRNAIQERLQSGQKAAMAQGQFDDFQTERGQRELVDQLRGLAAAGDKDQVSKILDDTQFLNEGALRQELTGVFDKTRANELRETAEGRAQRGEARSAASHALSMEAGRENLNYSKAMHSEGLRKLREDNTADTIAMEAFNGTKSANDAQNSLVSEIAAANNLTVQADGSINMRDVDPDVQDRVAQQLEEAGAGQNTATAARQRIVEMAKQQGLGTEGTKMALARYDTVKAFDAMAPEDQAKVQSEVAAATSDLTGTQKKLTETFNRKSKDNPFLAPSNDVTADSNKIVEAASKKYDSEWFSTDINRRSLGRETVDLLQNGIDMKLDGEDFTGVVPASLIERAILENGANKFLAEGGTVRKLVENYIKENKGVQKQIKESQSLTEQFQADNAKINAEKLKIENSITRSRQKEKGVTVSNNDWIDAMIRRRTASGN